MGFCSGESAYEFSKERVETAILLPLYMMVEGQFDVDEWKMDIIR